MKALFFSIFLMILTTGCIPKYVDSKPVPMNKVETKKLVEPIVSEPQVEEKIVQEVIKEQGISTSYKVTMKTKKFAFSDTGFLVKKSDMLQLNVLAMGKPVLDLKVKKSDDVCVGGLCNSKHGFNQSFLVGEYPDSLIENVLNMKPIFDGKNLRKTRSGFIQQISTSSYDIKYQISSGSIYFKDKKNKIIMKLRELK